MIENARIITPSVTYSETNFGSFYSTYYKRFFRYAYHYLNNPQMAEDITHDAILYYWENKDKIPPDTDVLGYILLTIKNKCLNYLKHLQIEANYEKQNAGLSEWEVNARIMTLEDEHYSDIFIHEIMEIVSKSLAKLPRQTRDIFLLHRIKFKSRKEIASELGVSIQKIDYHINKANDHLYKDLKDYLPIVLFFIQKFFS
jgi:RNA polymerase sigma-70 factor (ECF subfamily)